MARRMKVKLAFVINTAKRKASCKKRTMGLLKKMNELSILCGVEVCGMVHSSQLDPQIQFWPNKSDAERVVAEFKSLPKRKQTRSMLDLSKYTRKCISEVNEQLQKLLRANREKKLTQVMFDCLAGRSGLEHHGLEDLDALERIVDLKLNDIERRIGSLRLNDQSQAGASTSNVGGAARN